MKKQHQKKLLTELMQEDAKDGLYDAEDTLLYVAECQMTDQHIMQLFFNMLKRNGVEVLEEYDKGKEFTIISQFNVGGGNKENRTLTFCVDESGKYWRIMGYIGDFFTSKVHHFNYVTQSPK
jgi:hypothetical protein